MIEVRFPVLEDFTRDVLEPILRKKEFKTWWKIFDLPSSLEIYSIVKRKVMDEYYNLKDLMEPLDFKLRRNTTNVLIEIINGEKKEIDELLVEYEKLFGNEENSEIKEN